MRAAQVVALQTLTRALPTSSSSKLTRCRRAKDVLDALFGVVEYALLEVRLPAPRAWPGCV